MVSTDKRVQFAFDWVETVKQPILDVFYSLDSFDLKSNNTEVTQADRDTELAFRKAIRKSFPSDGIIGEEYSEQNREGVDYTWTIDPIDGTRAFARGVPFFGTMLSLYQNQEILFGLVVYPALGETIYAIKGQGCYWKADHMDVFDKVSVANAQELSDATLSFSGEEYFSKANLGEFIQKLKSEVLFCRTWGDCYGYSLLARGKIDIMCDPLLNQWDLVPIKIIVEEAGGKFVNFDGSPTTINSNNALCSNPTLINKILALS